MKKEHWYLLAFLAIGCALRVAWPGDMEWKTDEKLVHALALETARTGTFPDTGIKSGGGVVNPGMSVGIFAAIATFAPAPIAMVRVVQWANVISLLAFLAFALQRFEGIERRVWLSGLALAAVNPIAILFARKIWAQDLLPVFAFLIVLGHNSRSKPWGAFCWGLAGALMGQVHMSGFFYAAALFLLTVLHDRTTGNRCSWPAWTLGSLAGAITLVPWLMVMIRSPQDTTTSFLNVFQLNFFFYWLIDGLGLDSMYSLREGFWAFLREPFIAGTPAYLVGVAHLGLIFVGGVCVHRIIQCVRVLLGQGREHGWSTVFERLPLTGFHFLSILLGLGLMMPLAGVTIYQHYLICAFPFAYLFIAYLLRENKRLLQLTLVLQLIIALSFLLHIHRNGGAPDGDYGVSYAAQEQQKEESR